MFFLDDLPVLNSIIRAYHQTNKNFYAKRQEVDWITGAFFLARKQALIEAGLFDPKMFMYVEEVELCYRLKQKGCKIIYLPQTVAIHLKGASGPGFDAGLAEEFKGILYFYQKHKGSLAFLAVKSLLLCGSLLRALIFAIMGDSKKRNLYAKVVAKPR